MWTVGHFGGDFDAAIDGTGSEDQDVGFRSTDAVAVHAEEVSVFADRWEERAPLSLELNSQQVDAVALAEDFVEIVRDFNAKSLDMCGDQCRWAADDDSRTEFLQTPNVGSSDSAVQDVADQRDGQSGDFLAMLSDRENVEQSLCRMLVSPVARIENARF